MKGRVTPQEMLRTGLNLHGRPLTDRQHNALVKRDQKMGCMKSVPRPCIGCYSGIVPWNQGSDYCTACIRRG